MKDSRKIYLSLFIYISFLFFNLSSVSFAQQAVLDSAQETKEEKPSNSVEINPKDYLNTSEVEPKEYSEVEVSAACRKYENKYVSYAANTYLVEACTLREVQSSDFVYELTKRKIPIKEVDKDVIAKIPQGAPITVQGVKGLKLKKCKDLKHKYISFSYTDIYYVDSSCSKKLFPDYETYVEHRRKYHPSSLRDSVVEALVWEEFAGLATGTPFPTVLDKEFSKILSGKAGVEVIPIDEACKGLNGKLVSFHSKAYKIEKCHKKEIDLEKEMFKNKGKELKPLELTAEQWLSLPDILPQASSESKPKNKG